MHQDITSTVISRGGKLELVKIDNKNVWKITKMMVSKNQEDFVASNEYSIIEAFAVRESGYVALPFGLYEGGVPVGFVMIGYGSIGDDEEPEMVNDSYCIWRFMIDKDYQGIGLGSKAMNAVMEYIRTFPCGKAKYCWLSYGPENVAAKSLYHKFGFEENGEMDGDEIVAILKL